MSDREYKAVSFTNIKAQSSGRVRTGIAAVFGNIDAVGDRVMPGAFAKTLNEGAARARFLWNHNGMNPPIASIKELREVSRDELPEEVLAKAPDAAGGLLVKREYYANNPLSDWVLQAIDNGDVNEMSFAYDTIKSQMVTEPIDQNNPDNTRDVQELLELKLYDLSDVNWGCNSATVAAGAKNELFGLLPLGSLASQFLAIAEQIKAGARNASADQKLINLIHDTAVNLGAICEPEEEDGKSETTNSGQEKQESQAEAAGDSTSLAKLTLQAARLRAAILKI